MGESAPRLTLAALAFVMVLCTLVGGLRTSAPQDVATAERDRPVPWSPTPATAPTTASIPNPPACRARDLAAGPPTSGAGAGSAYWAVPLTNKGSASCSLPNSGYGLTAVGPGDRLTSLATTKGSGAVAVVEPGQAANFIVQARDSCNPAGTVLPHQRYTALRLHFPTGAVSLSGLHLLLCTPYVFTSFQVPQPGPPAPGTTPSLQAKVEAPATATAGSKLHFVVVLSNPSGMAVHFEACPVYTEGLYVVNPGARSEVTFRLNCAGARSIAGHSQVPFEMVVPVPSATGAAKLYWEIDPDGPAAGSVVMVTASRASPPQGSFAPGYITQVGKSQQILVLGTVNCGSRLCLQLWRGQGRGKGYTQLQPPPSSFPRWAGWTGSVGQLVFANAADGYAVEPPPDNPNQPYRYYATVDGGRTWRSVTFGPHTTADGLTASANEFYAVLVRCVGLWSSKSVARCDDYRLAHSRAGTLRWAAVPIPGTASLGDNQIDLAVLGNKVWVTFDLPSGATPPEIVVSKEGEPPLREIPSLRLVSVSTCVSMVDAHLG